MTTAIRESNNNNWRQFRNCRNALNKDIRLAKTTYLSIKFNDISQQWRFLENYCGEKSEQLPSCISVNGTPIISPKEVVNVANKYFVFYKNKRYP